MRNPAIMPPARIARRHEPGQAAGEKGRREEAHDLLAPVYDGFTEGFGQARYGGGENADCRTRLSCQQTETTTSEGARSSGVANLTVAVMTMTEYNHSRHRDLRRLHNIG